MADKKFELDCRGLVLRLHERTHVMGILNVTPDSFSDGGKYFNCESAIKRGIEMALHGADIIDVGAESTRPGAEPISVQEELSRLIPVIEGLLAQVQVPLSVDTYKAEVADEVLKRGVHLINDISACSFDSEMKHVISRYRVPLVMMHIKGKPFDMQKNPVYEDLLGEMMDYFTRRIEMVKNAGIDPEKIIIDPGIGFGKRLVDNYEILRHLEIFRRLGCPILIGPSRKSFISKVLQVLPDSCMDGTAAAVAIGIQNGADIVRVHDVKQMVNVCRISDLVVGKVAVSQ